MALGGLLAIWPLAPAQTAWAADPPTVDAAAGCTYPVATWSVAQRLEQLIMVSGSFSDLTASAPPASAGVGGFVLYGQPAAGSGPSIQSGLSGLAADATSAGQVVPWFSTDEEGGTVARLANVIGSLPSARQMAAQWSPSQVQAALANHGAAMRSLGVNIDLAPVLDTASPSNTIADESNRSFSDNESVVSAYGLAFANGLRASGVVPVVKHFPGLGHASANTDLGPAKDPTLAELEANDLIPFERAISASMPVVMVGHPSVPNLTGGAPASVSAATYRFLRISLHFSGVAMTDSLAAGALSSVGYTQASGAVAAVEAGADMVIIDAPEWQATLTALEQAVSRGALPLTSIDASVYRILAAKGSRMCPIGASVAVTAGATAYLFWDGTNHNLSQALGSAKGTLQGPTSLGIGPLGSPPAVGVDANNATYAYWKGTDGNLWEANWSGSQWVGPFNRGMGPLGSAPAVAITPAGVAFVFWKGADGNLWEATGPANAALPAPVNLGMGILGSPPAAAVDGNGYPYVYWKGMDGNLWEAYWNGTAWIGPTFHGMGALGSAPTVAMTPAGFAYVFWKGGNGDLWQALGKGNGALGGPYSRGMGPLGSGPTAGVDRSGATYVYWIGANTDAWEGFWNGTRWVGPISRGMGPLD